MKKIITIVFVCFLLLLFVFSNSNIIAVKESILLWANCVVPSLFPFFIAVELLNYTDIARSLGKLLNGIMRPLFNVPGVAAYALIMGLICSSPIGAKITLELYENKLITKNEAERILAFTNNTGPLFIIGTTGILLFGSKTIGYLLLITHILSSLTVGIILGIKSRINDETSTSYDNNYYKNSIIKSESADNLDLGSAISISIKKSISLILQIGGFMALFAVIISILNESKAFYFIELVFEKLFVPKDITEGLLTGLMELTTGLNVTAKIQTPYLSVNIILCAFLLGFSSISVIFQVISIISKSNLRAKTYIYGKLLHGLIAMLYTAILIRFIPIFNFDIKTNTTPLYLTKFILIIITLIVAFATILIKSELHHKFINKQYN